MDEQPNGMILSGCSALELAGSRGRLAGKLLHDMGAAVTRVEISPSDCVEDAESAYLDAGKERISIDIVDGAGRGTLLDLVKSADFLVESFPPGYLPSLGLGYAELSSANPGIIMASITDFGQKGTRPPVTEAEIQGAGGWLSVTGTPDTPMKLPGNQAYYTASLFAVNGMLLALRHRRRSGRGQYLDISIQECAAAVLDHALVQQVYQGITAERQGDLHRNNEFKIFPARDGRVLLSIHREWDTLVDWMDSEGLAGDLVDEKWRDEAARNAGIRHILEVIREWTLTHTVEELVATGQLMRLPWAGIDGIQDVLNNPQLAEREFFKDLDYKGKTYKIPGAPVRMSSSPWRSDDGPERKQ